jgi:hypothetical protein
VEERTDAQQGAEGAGNSDVRRGVAASFRLVLAALVISLLVVHVWHDDGGGDAHGEHDDGGWLHLDFGIGGVVGGLRVLKGGLMELVTTVLA